MNVLFTCAGRRNYLLRFFKEELAGAGKVLATDMDGSAVALIEADISFVTPAVSAPEYIECLRDICEKNNVGLLISLNDLELTKLSVHQSVFESVNTRVLISSPEVIDMCFDKMKTSQFLEQQGFNSPRTYNSISEASHAIGHAEVSFPLFVKPRWGSASIQIYKVTSEAELNLAVELSQYQLAKTALGTIGENSDAQILIQESLGGNEYGIDVLNDFDGNPVACYVKRKLGMRAGETDKSQLIDSNELYELGMKLGAAVGHVGNLDCDVFYDGQTAVVLELNPRFGGGYPFSHMSGANYPKAILDWCQEKPFNPEHQQKDYTRVVSKCDNIVFVS